MLHSISFSYINNLREPLFALPAVESMARWHEVLKSRHYALPDSCLFQSRALHSIGVSIPSSLEASSAVHRHNMTTCDGISQPRNLARFGKTQRIEAESSLVCQGLADRRYSMRFRPPLLMALEPEYCVVIFPRAASPLSHVLQRPSKNTIPSRINSIEIRWFPKQV